MKKFFENLLVLNGLNVYRNRELLFYRGMMFHDREKWWGSGGIRPAPHEGLDILYYAGPSDEILRFYPGSLVPAAEDGVVAAVISDILGKSLFLRHEKSDGNRCLYSVYAHVLPRENVGAGTHIRAGGIIAEIPSLDERKRTILPHLHLSIAWIPDRLLPGGISWEIIGSHPGITLLDPRETLGIPCRIINGPGSPVNTRSGSSRPS